MYYILQSNKIIHIGKEERSFLHTYTVQKEQHTAHVVGQPQVNPMTMTYIHHSLARYVLTFMPEHKKNDEHFLSNCSMLSRLLKLRNELLKGSVAGKHFQTDKCLPFLS